MKPTNCAIALAFVAIARSSAFVVRPNPKPNVRKIQSARQTTTHPCPTDANKWDRKLSVAFFSGVRLIDLHFIVLFPYYHPHIHSISPSSWILTSLPINRTLSIVRYPLSVLARYLDIQEAAKIAKSENDADDTADTTTSLLSFMVFDAILATKELALNWGFVLQSGITKLIGGFLALILPIYATEVALNGIAISLAVISTFNVILGFKGQGDKFKLQSFLLAAIQAFFSYRIIFYPFRSLRILTTLVASACIADGMFETIVAINNSDLPGRWTLLVSGLASIFGGGLVATNIGVSSLFVLGLLLGSNLLSSGMASVNAALFGRQIANKYLMDADFEGDAVTTIESVADAIETVADEVDT